MVGHTHSHFPFYFLRWDVWIGVTLKPSGSPTVSSQDALGDRKWQGDAQLTHTATGDTHTHIHNLTHTDPHLTN
jgi:hypothetical protein